MELHKKTQHGEVKEENNPMISSNNEKGSQNFEVELTISTTENTINDSGMGSVNGSSDEVATFTTYVHSNSAKVDDTLKSFSKHSGGDNSLQCTKCPFSTKVKHTLL